MKIDLMYGSDPRRAEGYPLLLVVSAEKIIKYAAKYQALFIHYHVYIARHSGGRTGM